MRYGLTASPTEPHCELCGGVIGQDSEVWDGYTTCCNELVCSGGGCITVTKESERGWRERLHFRSVESAQEFIADQRQGR